MKRLQGVLWYFSVSALLLARPALADHMAIIYCAVDEKNDVRVIAADANPTGEVWTSGKRGQSCSLVMHELMSLGYEISHTEVANFMNFEFLLGRTYVANAPTSSAGQQSPVPEGPIVVETRAKSMPLERGHIVFVLRKTTPHK